MKYIYYIAAIFIVFSCLAAYVLFGARFEISEPALSVNDRVFSKYEMDKLLANEPPDIDREEFVQSLIEQQLLIQEAIAQNINKEEAFRHAVQDFYEQSLIKTLLDRKQESLVVDVATDEVARFESLMNQKLVISKIKVKGGNGKSNMSLEVLTTMTFPFRDLSDNLQFIMLGISKGESSEPRKSGDGLVAYRLDDVLPVKEGEKLAAEELDVKRISLLIRDKKKERLLEDWLTGIREDADIWRAGK